MATVSPFNFIELRLLNKINIHHLQYPTYSSRFWFLVDPSVFFLRGPTSLTETLVAHHSSSMLSHPQGLAPLLLFFGIPSLSFDSTPCKCKVYLVYKAPITGHLHHKAFPNLS